MAAYRCEDCGINWEKGGECLKCGKLTTLQFWQKVTPRADREKAITEGRARRETAQLEELQVMDKVAKWRFAKLKEAGFGEVEALFIATRRDIDLHTACKLAGEAGPDLAYEILR